ncbi:MAG TPA: hypothetical protein VJI98_03745 [Candidatus Nanoarchaeia archaeon]|nr:hypothetical protein [Candidatus Nanoarchaeia archaeon]
MKPWLHWIEIIIDKSIPFLLVLLLLIIVGEFWFHDFVYKYRTIADILDSFIIIVFVIDLVFRYNRIRNFPKFLRASWLEILAVFPFFLIFRVIETAAGVFEAGEVLTRTQKVVHVGLEIEPEVAKAIKEGELIAKEAGRAERLGRFVRPLTRGVRFLKLNDPTVRKKAKRELRKGKKEILHRTKQLKTEISTLPRHLKAAIFYEKPTILKYVADKFSKD